MVYKSNNITYNENSRTFKGDWTDYEKYRGGHRSQVFWKW